MNSVNSFLVMGVRSFSQKTLSILICLYKMENNYETLRMLELKALARERRLRGYSQLRKAELIAFLQNNEHQVRSAGKAQAQRPPPPPPQMSTWEPQREPQTEARQPELEVLLIKAVTSCSTHKIDRQETDG